MQAIDHVVIPVRDPRATLAFYAGVLGLPLLQAYDGDDWGGYPWLMMIFGLPSGQEMVCVALKGAPRPSYAGLPQDVRHYAFAAASAQELAAWRGRLEAAGVAVWQEDHGDQRSIYFPDPDGVILEITWPASTARADPHAQAIVEAWIARAALPA